MAPVVGRRKAKKTDFKQIVPDTTYPLVDDKAIDKTEGGVVYKVRGFLNGVPFGVMFQYPNGAEVDHPDMVSLATEVGTIIQYQRVAVGTPSNEDWQTAVPIVVNIQSA